MNPDTTTILTTLLVLVVITAVAVVRLRNLFAATILLGIYSLLMALTWTVMLAMDVAFTEAAVGAGISTILIIAALIHTGSKEKTDHSLHLPSLLAVIATGGALIYGTIDMPRLGIPQAEVNRRAARYYMSDESRHGTHAPNMVTAVLASYRGFDTLFETAVIFTAGAGVILLLRSPRGEGPGPPASESGVGAAPPEPPPEGSPGAPPTPRREGPALLEQDVLRTLTKILIPFTIVFGIYVITHGEIGPGGGFQGGVIIAAAYILFALVFSLAKAREVVPRWLSDSLSAGGVLLYAGVGVATMFLGGSFLAYDQLNAAHPPKGQALGMTLVEIGVGLTVATVMVTLFSEMVEE